MMDLRDLYQEVILDHNRNPRHCYEIADADCQAEGYNPLCGDKLSLFLKIENDVIVDASFKGAGCAISTASASLMTEALIGLSVDKANHLFKHFHDAIIENDAKAWSALGKLAVLEGVQAYPARVKCATLAWHTLQAALNKQIEVACTEA